MVAGVLVGVKAMLPVVDAEDLAPSLHWPQPLLSGDADAKRGPVMVSIEYQVLADNTEAFKLAMEEVRDMRHRNGSFSWQLMQDTQNPMKWIEVFFDESWHDHLRHHSRVTRAELKIESAARRFQVEGIPVQIRHFLKG